MADDLSWDDLSTTPPDSSIPAPLTQEVPEDPSIPLAQAPDTSTPILTEANDNLRSGKWTDAQAEEFVSSRGKKRPAESKSTSLSWDDLSTTPPKGKATSWEELPSTQKPSELESIYQPPQNWAGQLPNSPIPGIQPDITQTASNVPVGFGEAAVRGAEGAAAGLSSLITGAAGALAYPITAADAVLSGRPVPSFSEAVGAAQAPYEQIQKNVAPQPGEEYGLAGQLGQAAGQTAVDLPTMFAGGAAAAPAQAVTKAATTGAEVAQNLATHLLRTFKITSPIAARAVKDDLQEQIDAGATPAEAMAHAATVASEMTAQNAAFLGVTGGPAARVAKGAALGAATAGTTDPTQLAVSTITGGALSALGERTPEGPTAKTRFREAAADLRRTQDIEQAVQDASKIDVGPLPWEKQNASTIRGDQGVVPEEVPQAREPVGGRGTEEGGEVGRDDVQRAPPGGEPAGDEGEQVRISDEEQAHYAAKAAFGKKGWDKLQRAGVQLESREDMDPADHPGLTDADLDNVTGYLKPGEKPVVVYDNNTLEELPNNVAHEVFHANEENLMPDKSQADQAAADLVALSKTNPEVKASIDKIPAGTPKNAYNREVLAYVMGDNVHNSTVQRILDRAAIGLNRLGVPKGWIDANPAIVREMAVNALHSYGEEAPRQNSYQVRPMPGEKRHFTAADIAAGKHRQAPLYAREDVTQTPEFKDWFGDSKVVDERGKPATVYHGTTADFTKFERGDYDIGMHFGPPGQANDRLSHLRRGEEAAPGEKILPVHLRIENPLRLKDEGTWDTETVKEQLRDKFPGARNVIDRLRSPEDVRHFLESKGHDGIVYRNTGETAGGQGVEDAYKEATRKMTEEYNKAGPSPPMGTPQFEAWQQARRQSPEYRAWQKASEAALRHRNEAAEDSYIALRPEQVKSATGNRTFDREEPNILYARRAQDKQGSLEDVRGGFGRGGEVDTNERWQSGARAGQYVGAPERYNTPAKIGPMRNKLRSLALEGESGKRWYETSGQAILRHAGGNIDEARKLAKVLAIYSPQAKVDANTTMALHAWEQYKSGQPIKTKTAVQDRFAERVLHGDGVFEGGEKTKNFYNNLMRHIDPQAHAKQGVTNDMWMMRAFGYHKDRPTDANYRFVENETNRLAKELGWSPEEVQASIWVAMKARTENAGVKERTEAESTKRGFMRYDATARGPVRNVLDEAAHRGVWFKHAMAHEPTAEDARAAAYDFGHALDERTAQLSHESIPSVESGVLPGIHNAPMEQKVEYHRAIQKALQDPDGRDSIDKVIGPFAGAGKEGFSGWGGKSTVGTQTPMPVYVKDGRVSDESRKLIELNQAVRGQLLNQKAMAWHYPVYKGPGFAQNGAEITLGRGLTEPENAALYKSLSRHLGHDLSPPIPTADGTGVRVLNFPEIANAEQLSKGQLQVATRKANEVFHNAVKMAVAEQPWHNEVSRHTRFQSDGNLFNSESSSGPANYQGRIAEAARSLEQARPRRWAGRSDIQDWIEQDLRPRVDAVNRDFADRYGWDSGGPLYSRSGGGARVLREPSGEDQGTRGSREPDGSLRGLPRRIPGYRPAADPAATRVAQQYMAERGIPYAPPNTYARVDPARAARIADAFAAMPHAPNDPKVASAYKAMIDETLAQYQAIKRAGLKVEFIDPEAGNPYPNPRDMTEDVRNNNHMWVFSTRDGFGSNDNFDPSVHPLLGDTGETISGKPALANDIFRVVHDYFGHVKEGVGFRADGEENAWRAHSAMYSPEARAAMTSETRGQNSWLNYGPHGEANRTAKSEDTIYADQKAGLLPDWVANEGATDEGPLYSRVEGKPHIKLKAAPAEPEPTPTSNKNASRAEQRAERELPPVPKMFSFSPDEVFRGARAAYTPDAGSALSAEVAKGDRATTPHEEALLLLHGANLRQRLDDAYEAVDTARKSGNFHDEVQAQIARGALDAELDINDRAVRNSGSNWSGTGRMRQQFANYDLSLATQMRRLQSIGPVPDTIARRAEQINREVKRMPRQTPVTPEGRTKAITDLAAKFRAAFGKGKPKPEGALYARVEDPMAAGVLRQMAKILAEGGETDPSKIIDAIHEAVGDTGIAKGDIADTIERALPKETKAQLLNRYRDLEREVHDLNDVQRKLGANPPEARVRDDSARLEREIADIQRQIDHGEDVPEEKTPRQRSQREEDLRAQLAAKKLELNNLRPAPPADRPEDPAIKRNRIRQKQLERQMKDIRGRIQRGDFKKVEPVRIKYNDETMRMIAERNRLKSEYDRLAEQHARSQMNPVMRTVDFLHNFHMAGILSSVHVYQKLAAAVLGQHVASHMNDFVGSIARHIPGLSKVYAMAPRHGQGWQYKAERAALAEGLPGAYRGAKEQWTYGQSRLEQAFANENRSAEFTDFGGSWANAMAAPTRAGRFFEGARVLSSYPGRTHAMVKEFIASPEFFKSLTKRMDFERKRLLNQKMDPQEVEAHMAKESTKELLSIQAMQDALESKMQGKNAFADSVNRWLVNLEKTGGSGGQLASFIFKSIFPIRKVPINIAKELTSYAGGGIKAGWNLATKGMKDMTPERADYIAKNINKQGTGMALAAIGYLGGTAMFGGVPGAEKKKKEGELQPNEAQVFGAHIGSEGFHGAPAMFLQLGAQFRRIHDKEYGDTSKSINEGLAAFAQQLERTIPYTEQARRTAQTLYFAHKEGRGWDQVAGNQLRSMVVPQALQQLAAWLDEDKGYRHPRNLWQDIEVGLPGLREDVPEQAPYKPKKQR